MALTKVVVRLDPEISTTEVFLKFVPVTVRVKAAAPAFLLVGLMLVSVGTGLLIVRSTAFEVPPPGVGLKTVMGNIAATVWSAAVI